MLRDVISCTPTFSPANTLPCLPSSVHRPLVETRVLSPLRTQSGEGPVLSKRGWPSQRSPVVWVRNRQDWVDLRDHQTQSILIPERRDTCLVPHFFPNVEIPASTGLLGIKDLG